MGRAMEGLLRTPQRCNRGPQPRPRPRPLPLVLWHLCTADPAALWPFFFFFTTMLYLKSYLLKSYLTHPLHTPCTPPTGIFDFLFLYFFIFSYQNWASEP